MKQKADITSITRLPRVLYTTQQTSSFRFISTLSPVPRGHMLRMNVQLFHLPHTDGQRGLHCQENTKLSRRRRLTAVKTQPHSHIFIHNLWVKQSVVETGDFKDKSLGVPEQILHLADVQIWHFNKGMIQCRLTETDFLKHALTFQQLLLLLL